MTTALIDPQQVELSVVVPVFNGGKFFERSLRSLHQSTFRSFELIVVDDGSTDNSVEIARRQKAQVLSLPRRGGPARARNRGAAAATGACLLFLDADVCVHRDTLQRVVDHFRANPQAVALMGSYDAEPTDPHFLSQYKNLFHHYVHQHGNSRASTFWAGCGAVRREEFLDLGGFDEGYDRPCIEDIELGVRMHARGWRIDLVPTIQVTHLKRWTFSGLLRTDLRDRAVPWLTVMLRQGSMPADLNVGMHHRLSVVLVNLLLLASGLSFRIPGAFGVSTTLAAWLVFLNRDLYGFFWHRRGAWFALRALPMHWFYYWYCGLAVLWVGTINAPFLLRRWLLRARDGVA